MRACRILLAVAVAALPACNCGQAPAPTPVKLVVTNDLGFDIFVPNDQSQLGLAVGQGDASSFAAISEGPACDCQRCASACDQFECSCSSSPMAHRLHPGAKASRTFAGTEFVPTRADCGSGDLGPICFKDGQPLAAGTYSLQLCFAANAPGADQGQDDFATSFDPSSLTCVTEQFNYPEQTEWDISPPKPPPCDASHACPGDELCQQGVCSASCLANSVPALGSGWTVSTTVDFDAAFFTHTGNRLTGTGTVGAVTYKQGVLDLPLRRDADRSQAELTIALPPSVASLPLVATEPVSLLVIPQTSDPESPSAVVIRDGNGKLLLAAELDQGTPVLSSADLAPFGVSPSGTPFACDSSNLCGRKLHTTMFFDLNGAENEVQPGQTVSLSANGTSWNATAVANFTLPPGAPQIEECSPPTAFGYVIAAVN